MGVLYYNLFYTTFSFRTETFSEIESVNNPIEASSMCEMLLLANKYTEKLEKHIDILAIRVETNGTETSDGKDDDRQIPSSGLIEAGEG